jgi:hypothetical protein
MPRTIRNVTSSRSIDVVSSDRRVLLAIAEGSLPRSMT